MKKISKVTISLLAAIYFIILLVNVSVYASSPADTRSGVVRIFTADRLDNPTWFSTGSGFAVGIIGEESDTFITNRHVIYDKYTQSIANNVYIMLDDDAVKKVFTSLGGFMDDETNASFKLVIDKSHLVKCDVLYPNNSDPEFPDYAILRAKELIPNRYALELKNTDEIQDGSSVWSIGYPGSADSLYNLDTEWDEMKYEADIDGVQMFTGVISRRGKMKRMGNTLALTHSAQIDHGNSGGPLVTQDGKVIGINTYGFESIQSTSVGYYLSVYINYVIDKLNELKIPFNIISENNNEAKKEILSIADDNNERKPIEYIKKKVSLNVRSDDFENGEFDSRSIMEYNEYGDFVLYEMYDKDGGLSWKDLYKYNSDRQLIELLKLDGDGKTFSRYEYTYDNKGNKIFCKEYNNDGDVIYESENVYDDTGNLIGEYSHFDSGTSHSKYYYNADGTRRKMIRYDSEGIIKSTEEYEYDDAGNKIIDVRYEGDGSLDYYYEYQYDSNNMEIARARYNEDGLCFIEEYTYDDKGNKMTDVTFDNDGSVKSVEEYSYDKYGNLVFSVEYDSNGELKGRFDHDYEYDDEGYILSQRIYRNNVLWMTCYYDVVEILVEKDGQLNSHVGRQ